jgi:hypothetical protein
MLQFLIDGHWDAESGEFLTPVGHPCCFYACDKSERYRGLTPCDLMDIAVMNSLDFHAASGEGIAFQLIGVLPEFGKLGAACIGRTSATSFDRLTAFSANTAGGAERWIERGPTFFDRLTIVDG